MKIFIEHLTERNYQKRTIGLIENGLSWAPTAARVMTGMFEKSKDITWLEHSVKIMSSLSEENEKELECYGRRTLQIKFLFALLLAENLIFNTKTKHPVRTLDAHYPRFTSFSSRSFPRLKKRSFPLAQKLVKLGRLLNRFP